MAFLEKSLMTFPGTRLVLNRMRGIFLITAAQMTGKGENFQIQSQDLVFF